MLVVWLVMGVGLLWFELHHRAFYALFAALGCFAAAGVAAGSEHAYLVQAVVGAVVTAAGVIVVRPYVSRAFDHRYQGNVARGVHGGLVGQEAVTLDEVGDLHTVGHARLAGERWLAVSKSGQVIEAGMTVMVTDVQGTTLTVDPVPGAVARPTVPVEETPAAEAVVEADAPEGAERSSE